MVNVKLLNKTGQLVKLFHSVKAAYKYAEKCDLENFSVQTTLI
jgi:hypothetical protein